MKAANNLKIQREANQMANKQIQKPLNHFFSLHQKNNKNLDSVLGKVKDKQQTQFYQEGENHSLENKSQYRVKQNIQYLSDQKILQKEKEKEKQEKMNFWKLNSGEYLERKYRSLTNQGYMDGQTYKKIMGLKPINNVEKLKKRRKNYSLHQNSNYKPQDILYQYLYNQNEGLPLNDVQQIFLDKELDLVNKKKIVPGYMQALKVTHPDQAQIEENEHQQQKIDEFASNYQFPNMIGLGSQNPSTFEPRYKYMKYFRHNEQLLNMESATAKKSITQIQTPQYTQGTSFYGKFNSNSVNDKFSEEKTLPRTFYKPKKPNSTLQQQLQDEPEKEVPVVYEGNVYKRYDTKYKAQLESTFNISFDRKFDPYYNKNKEIEHMEPLKRKQEREQYIGGFNPNQTYVDSAENNIYYPKRPINSSANNLLNFSNSHSKTQRQLESKSVQHQNCRKPCCYPKLDQKNLVYNPDFLASLPDKYQGMSSTRCQSQTKTNKFRNQIKLNKTSFSNNFRYNNINKINNNQKSGQKQRQSPINNYEVVSDDMHKIMEGEYYLNYDKQMQEQSKETLALLDSVFAQGGTYNKQEMCTLLNDFKKKYGVLAEMQDRKINALKKEYYHNLKFNLES
ncbi:hypothetical protein PPERSA_08999 [Pseudocohnilembus persalinus]|uniref:Uncharacterized protein n=1 Tax=Pseudocohnilembus persalinus TaxID=266149 RepID=A0A0V0R302_PSEPJ|nr:hypothetical protein PPERSA_08999 [Pseudocohnilembus persalinus]|eukprot:KRX08895.1 hypothetical protein PPERSA_08999 [Pseudocohnilembus persalinus]